MLLEPRKKAEKQREVGVAMSLPIAVVDTDALIMSAGHIKELAYMIETTSELSMTKVQLVDFMRNVADEKLRCAAWIRVLEKLAFENK
jgi:hypothetical protein